MMTQKAFLDTLMPLQPALQLVAERLLHSEADAEDTVQEVVVELWEKRDELAHVRSLEAYAMQTVKHRCISLLRKRREVAVDDLRLLEGISDEEAAAESARLEEQSAQLDRMMERLPERQRMAVRMKYIDCLSHEEIQRRLQMSSENVYTTLSRAVSALKTMLKK